VTCSFVYTVRQFVRACTRSSIKGGKVYDIRVSITPGRAGNREIKSRIAYVVCHHPIGRGAQCIYEPIHLILAFHSYGPHAPRDKSSLYMHLHPQRTYTAIYSTVPVYIDFHFQEEKKTIVLHILGGGFQPRVQKEKKGGMGG
jgi:hypothetical protein